MIKDKEYPATHSMSTAWFCADLDGNVAIIDIDDDGPVPVGTGGYNEGTYVYEIWSETLPTHTEERMYDLPLTDEQIVPLLLPKVDENDIWTEDDGIYANSIVDCSAYVSWVLYCAGYQSFNDWQETSFRTNHHELVEVSSSDIQPGDVLVYSDHVEMAAKVEGGTVTRVYNCGSDYSIQSAGTSDCPESVEAIRWDYVVVLRAPN